MASNKAAVGLQLKFLKINENYNENVSENNNCQHCYYLFLLFWDEKKKK